MSAPAAQSSLSETDTAQPSVGRSPVPVGLLVLSLLLVFCAMYYYDLHGGWAGPQVYSPYRSEEQLASFQPDLEGFDPKRGREIYERVCALCHGNDGLGKPNQFPPFVGSEWVTESPARLIRIPLLGLNGPISVKGQQWNLSMPAQGGALNDADLAAALSYIRLAFGNKAPEITEAQVAAVRAQLGARGQPFTAAEILSVPDK